MSNNNTTTAAANTTATAAATRRIDNPVFINHYPAAMIHNRTYTNKNGVEKQFVSVSISCPASKSGMGSIALNLKQVLPALKKNQPVEGRRNLFLGAANETRQVSIATNKAKTKFKNIEMTNKDIADMVNNARAAYKASLAS